MINKSGKKSPSLHPQGGETYVWGLILAMLPRLDLPSSGEFSIDITQILPFFQGFRSPVYRPEVING
jgi:hypothetical protein